MTQTLGLTTQNNGAMHKAGTLFIEIVCNDDSKMFFSQPYYSFVIISVIKFLHHISKENSYFFILFLVFFLNMFCRFEPKTWHDIS